MAHDLPDVISVATAVVDRDGTILAVNQRWRDFASENGAPERTRIGVGLSYLAASAGVVTVATSLKAFLSGQSPDLVVEYSCHAPEELRWFRLVGKRLADGATALMHHDITGEHLAERLLRLQADLAVDLAVCLPAHELLERFLINACDHLAWDHGALWSVEETGLLTLRKTHSVGEVATRFAEAAARASLSPGWDLVGRAALSGTPLWAADLTAIDGPRAAAAHGVGLRSGVALPVRSEGRVTSVIELLSTVRRPSEFRTLAMLGVTMNQVEEQERRLRAEDGVARAHTFMRAVLKDVPGIVAVVDRAGRIEFLNRSEYGPEVAVVGSSWLKLLPTEHHEAMTASLAALFRTGKPSVYEGSAALPDGSRQWFSNLLSPFVSGGSEHRAILLSQDVTETKRLQAEILSADRMAAIGTLAAGVAHEINTPIQFVSDSVHFLRDAASDVLPLVDLLSEHMQVASDPERALRLRQRIETAMEGADLEYLREAMPRAFERCVEGLDRVATIVRSMKEFSRAPQQHMEAADLNRAIQNTLVIARSEYKEVADVELELGELPLVVCHLGDINRVVLNLVVNAAHAIGDAVKGTGANGRIRVKTALEGPEGPTQMAVVSIADTGTGIPEHVQPRVFEPFFTTKEVGRGTGQGLSMAWSIVKDRHKGSISFETQQGVGTTFHVRVPVAGAAALPGDMPGPEGGGV